MEARPRNSWPMSQCVATIDRVTMAVLTLHDVVDFEMTKMVCAIDDQSIGRDVAKDAATLREMFGLGKFDETIAWCRERKL